jgi:hypothetical protein
LVLLFDSLRLAAVVNGIEAFAAWVRSRGQEQATLGAGSR